VILSYPNLRPQYKHLVMGGKLYNVDVKYAGDI